MNEKITMQDIIEQIAKKHGMTRKDSEAFVRGMFELIAEALATESYVRIKGLGTFKLTEVDSRESVNVNTGERIEIQGHTKISFTPDTTMKDQINKPFAHFETVMLNDGTRTEDMEAEVLNVETTVEEAIAEQLPAEESVVLQPVEEEVLPAIEEPVSMPEPAAEEETVLPAEEEVQAEEPTPVPEEVAVAEEKPSESEEERKTLWGIILAIILILCVAGGIYWYMQSTPDEPQRPTTAVETPQKEVPMTQPQDTVVQEIKTDSIVASEPTQEVPTAVKPETPKVVLSDTIEYEITGTMTTLTLQPGETLVKLALRFYGTKNLWHYIVQHNQDVITDADRVPIGTTLRIPELSIKR